MAQVFIGLKQQVDQLLHVPVVLDPVATGRLRPAARLLPGRSAGFVDVHKRTVAGWVPPDPPGAGGHAQARCSLLERSAGSHQNPSVSPAWPRVLHVPECRNGSNAGQTTVSHPTMLDVGESFKNAPILGVSGRSHSEKNRRFYALFGGSASVSHGPLHLDRWVLGLTCLARLFGGGPPVGQAGMSVLLRPP